MSGKAPLKRVRTDDHEAMASLLRSAGWDVRMPADLHTADPWIFSECGGPTWKRTWQGTTSQAAYVSLRLRLHVQCPCGCGAKSICRNCRECGPGWRRDQGDVCREWEWRASLYGRKGASSIGYLTGTCAEARMAADERLLAMLSSYRQHRLCRVNAPIHDLVDTGTLGLPGSE